LHRNCEANAREYTSPGAAKLERVKEALEGAGKDDHIVGQDEKNVSIQ
jgi:hypothetical protein